MNLTSVYFGFRGRLNRTQYGMVLLLGYLALFAIFLVAESSMHNAGDPGALVSLAMIALMLWILVAAMSKRFHDINKSGWATLLILVPVVGLLTPLVLLFYPGDTTDNQFGPPPT